MAVEADSVWVDAKTGPSFCLARTVRRTGDSNQEEVRGHVGWVSCMLILVSANIRNVKITLYSSMSISPVEYRSMKS